MTNPTISNAAFHHIEMPCNDLALAEQFYSAVLGARVYMRRDAERRKNVPVTGTIAEAEAAGFSIDGTYMRIGDSLRIGFLKRNQEHCQNEIDHLAFTIDDDDLDSLAERLNQQKVAVLDQTADRLLARDPFGLVLELWPRKVLAKMGLL